MLADRLSQAAQRDVSRETAEKVGRFGEALLTENERQNLISKNSENSILERHILDGAQLLRFDNRADAHWVDIGTGPGLPGMIIALLHDGPVTLVEPRALRTAFLKRVVEEFTLGDQVRIIEGKAAHLEAKADVITGRAVAPLSRFLNLSLHLSTGKTRWILPKGAKALQELEDAKRAWQLNCHIETSLTDPEAKVLVIDRAKRRGRG